MGDAIAIAVAFLFGCVLLLCGLCGLVRWHWWVALAFALIPIPIGWLLGWLLISTGRWIRRGFS
jgi:hypothetical protein